MSQAAPTLYQILGVRRNATAERIHAAYRRKAKTLHPDGGGDRAAFERLKRARDVLCDPARRRVYDETGVEPPEAPPAANAMAEIYAGAAELAVAVLSETGDPKAIDLIAEMNLRMQAAISSNDEAALKIKAVIGRITTAAERITRRDGGDNTLATLLAGKAEEQRKRLEIAQLCNENAKRLIEFLDGFTYRVDGRAMRIILHGATTTATSAWGE